MSIANVPYKNGNRVIRPIPRVVPNSRLWIKRLVAKPLTAILPGLNPVPDLSAKAEAIRVIVNHVGGFWRSAAKDLVDVSVDLSDFHILFRCPDKNEQHYTGSLLLMLITALTSGS